MAAAKTLEDIITEQAPIVCEQIEAAVSFAESEEDLRVEIEKAIEVFRKEADLPELKGHHEVTIGKGRADSVYDYVFIEYKKPGRLKESNDSPGNREVVKQLQERAKAFKAELKRDPNELFGVGTDGNYFVTGRYRSGRWEINPARERSVYVVEDFLRKLSSLGVAGKPFLPEYLAGDFGAESERKLAREGIEKLYRRIREVEKEPDTYPKAKVLFDQWRILFGEVCGYDIKNPTSKIKQLGEFYGVKKDPNPAALLFSVHSYYALFMKFLAAEIATMFGALSTSFLAGLHQAGSTEKLREKLRELEDGGIYRHLGIKNFLEGDLFSWYLDTWDDNVEKIIRQMVACLDEYDPKTLSIDPVESRDLLKKLYQQLFPKTVRHDLGEYYTPDWLAELVIERVGYDGNPDKRVLDPACGSGTFLVMAINKVREYADKQMIPKHELLAKILDNIVGFDLNPLAVMAARTNYLLALRELLKLGGDIEIPVYLCDSIMTPAEYGELITKEGVATGGIGKVQELKTSAARFMIPTEIAQSRQTVAAYTEELEHCVRNDYSGDEFISRLKGERLPVDSEDLHETLYRQVLKLKKQNQNDIWARIIKNSFAPLFLESVDYVIGNPPWINIENLPTAYRDEVAPLWDKYGLRHTLSGPQIGSTKRDICALFAYSSCDHYLRQDGTLGFVLTQSLFKSKGGGDGFRRLSYKTSSTETYLYTKVVHDLSDFNIFAGATNRVSVFVCQKKETPTNFPVEYIIWRPVDVTDLPEDWSLGRVVGQTDRIAYEAVPSDPQRTTSPWLTVDSKCMASIAKMRGKNFYRGYTGVYTGGLNGVYWLSLVGERAGNHIYQNLGGIGKKHVKALTASVEDGLVYPLVRGRDVQRWRSDPSACILIPYSLSDNSWIDEKELKHNYPKAYAFLSTFKDILLERKTALVRQQMKRGPFYAMVAVARYTFAPWKVVYKRLSDSMQAAVIPGEWVPHEKLVLIPSDAKGEAHYVAALLNSSAANLLMRSAAVRVQTMEYAPSDIAKVAIPKFSKSNGLHAQLSKLSEKCHSAAAKSETETLRVLEEKIDKAAAELWGITPKELKQIQKALKER